MILKPSPIYLPLFFAEAGKEITLEDIVFELVVGILVIVLIAVAVTWSLASLCPLMGIFVDRARSS